MKSEQILSILRPGDMMFYGAKGFFGWLIRVESRQPVAHVETYMGDGMSYASRDGIGVNEYPVRLQGLVAIVRPKEPLNIPAMREWFGTVKGQKYDWWSIVGFSFVVQLCGERSRAWLRKQGKKRQFCSEFCTRLSRIGGVDPLPGADADEVMPYELMQSAACAKIWIA